MTGKKEKTISGAMYSAPNLEHNLRTHIPPNSVEERRHLNMVYTDDWGITLQQVYEKLFAEHYRNPFKGIVIANPVEQSPVCFGITACGVIITESPQHSRRLACGVKRFFSRSGNIVCYFGRDFYALFTELFVQILYLLVLFIRLFRFPAFFRTFFLCIFVVLLFCHNPFSYSCLLTESV